jgi:hypothetical protein
MGLMKKYSTNSGNICQNNVKNLPARPDRFPKLLLQANSRAIASHFAGKAPDETCQVFARMCRDVLNYFRQPYGAQELVFPHRE